MNILYIRPIFERIIKEQNDRVKYNQDQLKQEEKILSQFIELKQSIECKKEWKHCPNCGDNNWLVEKEYDYGIDKGFEGIDWDGSLIGPHIYELLCQTCLTKIKVDDVDAEK